MPSRYFVAFAACVLSFGTGAAQQSTNAGLFEGHGDVGDNPKAGSFAYVTASGEYRVTGGGANVWAATDAFQFAWKRSRATSPSRPTCSSWAAGAVAHRKAMLMVRQNLNADSPYADAALHGDGLTSLQYRPAAGVATQEVRSTLTAPMRIRLERRGNQLHPRGRQAGRRADAHRSGHAGLAGPGLCRDRRLLARRQRFRDRRFHQRSRGAGAGPPAAAALSQPHHRPRSEDQGAEGSVPG